MANIELWFPTAIYIQENLFDEKTNKKWQSEILEWPKTIPSGGADWEGETYTTHETYDLTESPSFVPLIEKITDHVHEFARAHNSMYNYRVQHSWANIAQPGNFQEYHTHDGSIFSAVYYIAVPEGSGNIVFEDPRMPDMLPMPNITERNNLSYIKTGYKPKVGDLLIFRSYIRHCVQTGKNEVPRISAALNFG